MRRGLRGGIAVRPNIRSCVDSLVAIVIRPAAAAAVLRDERSGPRGEFGTT